VQLWWGGTKQQQPYDLPRQAGKAVSAAEAGALKWTNFGEDHGYGRKELGSINFSIGNIRGYGGLTAENQNIFLKANCSHWH
jgi:hypothetical protein